MFKKLKIKIFSIAMVFALLFNNIVFASDIINPSLIDNNIEVESLEADVISFENAKEMQEYMDSNNISNEDIFIEIPYVQNTQRARSIGYLSGTITFPTKSSFKITFLHLGTGNISKLSYVYSAYDLNYNYRSGGGQSNIYLSPLQSYSKTYSTSITQILKIEVGYDFIVDGQYMGGYGEKYNY